MSAEATFQPSFEHYWSNAKVRASALILFIPVMALAMGWKTMLISLAIVVVILMYCYLNAFRRSITMKDDGFQLRRLVGFSRLIRYDDIREIHRFYGKTEGEDAHYLVTVYYRKRRRLRFNSLHWREADLLAMCDEWKRHIPKKVTPLHSLRRQNAVSRLLSRMYEFYEEHFFLFMLYLFVGLAILGVVFFFAVVIYVDYFE